MFVYLCDIQKTDKGNIINKSKLQFYTIPDIKDIEAKVKDYLNQESEIKALCKNFESELKSIESNFNCYEFRNRNFVNVNISYNY